MLDVFNKVRNETDEASDTLLTNSVFNVPWQHAAEMDIVLVYYSAQDTNR